MRRIGAVSVVAITLRSNARSSLEDENEDEGGVAALGKQYKILGVVWIEAWPMCAGVERDQMYLQRKAQGAGIYCNALPGTVMIPQVVVVVCTEGADSRFRRR